MTDRDKRDRCVTLEGWETKAEILRRHLGRPSCCSSCPAWRSCRWWYHQRRSRLCKGGLQRRVVSWSMLNVSRSGKANENTKSLLVMWEHEKRRILKKKKSQNAWRLRYQWCGCRPACCLMKLETLTKTLLYFILFYSIYLFAFVLGSQLYAIHWLNKQHAGVRQIIKICRQIVSVSLIALRGLSLEVHLDNVKGNNNTIPLRWPIVCHFACSNRTSSLS